VVEQSRPVHRTTVLRGISHGAVLNGYSLLWSIVPRRRGPSSRALVRAPGTVRLLLLRTARHRTLRDFTRVQRLRPFRPASATPTRRRARRRRMCRPAGRTSPTRRVRAMRSTLARSPSLPLRRCPRALPTFAGASDARAMPYALGMCTADGYSRVLQGMAVSSHRYSRVRHGAGGR
jgi:hypothetical protein